MRKLFCTAIQDFANSKKLLFNLIKIRIWNPISIIPIHNIRISNTKSDQGFIIYIELLLFASLS